MSAPGYPYSGHRRHLWDPRAISTFNRNQGKRDFASLDGKNLIGDLAFGTKRASL
jgi:hypothetical protein